VEKILVLAKKRAKMEFALQIALSRRGWVWEHTESLALTKERPAANVLYVWLVVGRRCFWMRLPSLESTQASVHHWTVESSFGQFSALGVARIPG
jgi:hypothetical protein